MPCVWTVFIRPDTLTNQIPPCTLLHSLGPALVLRRLLRLCITPGRRVQLGRPLDGGSDDHVGVYVYV